MAKTTAEFLEGLKEQITMPANQVLLTDNQILSMSSDLMRVNLTKLLKASQQNYLLTYQDVPVVANQERYDVPYRAVSNGLEYLEHVLDDNQTFREMAYLTVEDRNMYLNAGTYGFGFYFVADQVAIVPRPQDAIGFFRMWYHRQLPRLCPTSQGAQVTAINGNVVTVALVPDSFVAGATVVDFIKSRSLSTTLGQDAVITNIAGTQLTFDPDVVPARLIVGDWIAPAGFSPILPLPDEMFDYFEGLTGIQVLKAIGDNEGAQNLQKDVDDDERDIKSLLEPRINGEPEKIVNYHNLLREKSWRPFGYFRR